jgi:hypothetical protein
LIIPIPHGGFGRRFLLGCRSAIDRIATWELIPNKISQKDGSRPKAEVQDFGLVGQERTVSRPLWATGGTVIFDPGRSYSILYCMSDFAAKADV